MSDAFVCVYESLFYDLQNGRVLEYKVTDKNYILQVEVRKRILILFDFVFTNKTKSIHYIYSFIVIYFIANKHVRQTDKLVSKNYLVLSIDFDLPGNMKFDWV